MRINLFGTNFTELYSLFAKISAAKSFQIQPSAKFNVAKFCEIRQPQKIVPQNFLKFWVLAAEISA